MAAQTAARPTEIDIDIPGLTLAAKAWGPDDGRPVLAAHGWLDNAASFDRLAPLLDGLRLVAIDFPGHGRSEHRPVGAAYHFIDWVPVLFDAADALGWQSFSLLCHSMGAAAATLAAGTFPERVERMALIDGLGPWTTPADQAPEQLAKALEERRVLADKKPRQFPSPEAVVSIVAEIHAISVDNANLLVERGLERQDEDHWGFSYDLTLRGASHLRLTEEQVLAFFGRIACPTLLVRPKNGWPADPELMQRRIGAIDALRVADVDGNHHVHMQHPERVVDIVRSFLC
jgi:pimeloyl-ACP methyl ester carboxylesterase